MIKFGEGLKIVQALSPQSSTAAVKSTFVDTVGSHWATFMVSLGNLKATSGDNGKLTINIGTNIAQTSTASGSTLGRIAWSFRTIAADGTMSAITDVSSTQTGVIPVHSTTKTEAYTVIVDVPGRRIVDKRFLRLEFTPNILADGNAAVTAFLDNRYRGG